jgi:methionine-rich copper-binding protein CopC
MKSVRKLIGLSLGFLLLFPSSAHAHAQVTETFPKNNSTLTQVPQQVWIEFDGNLTEIEGVDVNFLEVRDSSGASITIGKTIVAGARVFANLSARVNSGIVKVTYRVVSGDGHPVEGGFTFNLINPDSVSSDVSLETNTPTNSTYKNEPATSPGTEKPAMPLEAKEPLSTAHQHQSFFHRHSIHIYEALIATIAIAGWFIYERRKRLSNR